MQQSPSETKSRLACQETPTPWRFVTSSATLRHWLLALSQINTVHTIPSYFFKVHFNSALPSTSRSSWLSPSLRFYDNFFLHIAHFSRACNMLCPSHLPTLDDLNKICRTEPIVQLITMLFYLSASPFPPLLQIFPSASVIIHLCRN